MSIRVLCGIAIAAVSVATAAAGEIVSGLAVGAGPTPFHPVNINGEYAGKKNCLVCEYGGSPVVAIFARKKSDALTGLVKKLDAAGDKGLKSFVVFLSDDETLPTQLKKDAADLGLKHTIFAIDNVTGPRAWTISKDAEVTAVLYARRKVESNQVYASGKLDSAGVDRIVAVVPKLLEAKGGDDD